ncbi:MAG: response regulator [Pseudomonadales bacterium]|nr:response regulator [Pseudomonadales bacterium]
MKTSIRSRLTFTIFMTAIVPMIILIVGGYYSMREELLNRRGEKRQQIAQMAINQANDLVYDATESIRSWSSTKIMADILNGDNTKQIENLLRSNYIQTGMFSEITVTDVQGDIIASALTPGPNQAKATWFKSAMARRELSYSHFAYYDLAEDFSIPIALPIYSQSDNHTIIGTIVGFFSWTRLLEVIHSLDIGEGAGTRSNYVVLLDQFGNTIAGPQFTLLMEDDDEGDTLKTVNFVEMGITEAGLATQGKSGFSLTNYNDIEQLIAYAGSHSARKLPNFNWGILLFENSTLVFEPIVILRNVGFGLTVFFSCLIFIITFFIARRFTAPLQALNNGALRISQGDYNSQLAISRDDEIGQLSLVFNSMAESLRQKNNDIEHHITELELARDKALVADQAKSDFLSNMSHEIRTPMNAIIGFSQILIRKSTEPSSIALLLKVKSASDHLMSLINNILDLSKLDAGQTSLEHAPFSISSVMNDLSNMFGDKLQKSNIAFFISIDPQIPYTLLGDEHRLQQVLTNLVGNASKFIKTGAIIVEISIQESNDNADQNSITLLFSVKDTGIGIKPEVVNRLFERFTQADESSTREYGGTGLGLSISKNIVQLMEGSIWVETRFDQGSQFYFTSKFELKTDDTRVIDENLPVDTHFIWLSQNLDIYSTSVTQSLNRYHISHEVHDSFKDIVDKLAGDTIILLDYQQLLIESEKAVDKYHISNTPSSIRFIFSASIGSSDLPENLHSLNYSTISYPINVTNLKTELDRLSQETGYEHIGKNIDHTRRESIPEETNQLSSLKILIVDDVEANTLLLKLIFESKEVEIVDIAINGQEAIDAVSRQQYDVILMDVQMPVMNGLVATELIRKRYSASELPIIAMTANAMVGDREECISVGMNEYISKPIDHVKLFEILSKVLKKQFLTAEDLDVPAAWTASMPIAGKNTDVDEYGWPSFIEGIDIPFAKSRVRNDIGLYLRLLEKFNTQFDPIMRTMSSLVSEGDSEQLIKEAHKLAGTSGNLGFKELRLHARFLEQSLRENKSDDIIALYSNCMQTFEIIKSSIENLQLGYRPLISEANNLSTKTTPVPKEELVDGLNDLKNALLKSDIKSIELFRDIVGVMPHLMNQDIVDLDSRMVELETLIMNFQFANALERLNEIS